MDKKPLLTPLEQAFDRKTAQKFHATGKDLNLYSKRLGRNHFSTRCLTRTKKRQMTKIPPGRIETPAGFSKQLARAID